MKKPLSGTARNFKTVLSGQAITTILGFAALALNTRTLGIANLGVLFLIQATVELITKLASFRNWQTMIRFGSVARERGDGPALLACFRFGTLLDFVAGAVAVLVCGAWFIFLPGTLNLPSETVPYALVFVGLQIFTSNQTSVGALRMCNRFDLVVGLNVATAAAILVNAAILWWLSAPLQVFLITVPAISAIGGVAIIIAAVRRIGAVANDLHPGRAEPFDRRGFFSFATGVSLASSLTAFRQRGEVLLIGGMLGPAAVAYFGVAYRLAALLNRVADAGRQAVYPELADLVSADRTVEAVRIAMRFCRFALIGSVVGILILGFFGHFLLRIFFGAELVAAWPNLMLMGAAAALQLAVFALGPLIQIIKGSGYYLKLTSLAFVGFAICTPVALLTLGAAGAGIGSLIFAGLVLILMIRAGRKLVVDAKGTTL